MREVPKQLRPYLFKKGNKLGGKKKGSKSMKTWVKERLEVMPEKERIEFLKHIESGLVWRMGEGNPQDKTDITSGGKRIGLFDFTKKDVKNREDDSNRKDTEAH